MSVLSFGDRMKGYEAVSQNSLMRRTPVIIRIDGKAFHTFTKGLNRPFDQSLSDAMAETTLELCKQIQGAIFGYTQSDEISILLQDWKNLNTDCWFGYDVQKVVSISASIATAKFNKIFQHPSSDSLALFDSRAYNIPESEVVNYFIWRGSDCSRNSVSALAQSYFSHKQLHGKSVSVMQDMLMLEHSVNWNDVETRYKRGICIVPDTDSKFKVDFEPPMFTKDRSYIENLLKFNKD